MAKQIVVKVRPSTYKARIVGELLEIIEPDSVKVRFKGETHYVVGLSQEVMALARSVMEMKEVQ